ncbi:MAG: hypothetical protein M1836_000265 [Candelina mexicana]|nr:MAG: hypothetical protein M1836_000265 [Candelina mexicana]
MYRAAISRSLHTITRAAAPRQQYLSRSAIRNSTRSSQSLPATSFQAIRYYSAPAGLGKLEVEGRIMDLLKNFDKVNDPSKLSNTSHFSNDLGLDSLDTVEVVMAIEEVNMSDQACGVASLTMEKEFSIEIPDKEADAIHSIDKAVAYILAQPDGILA